MEPITSALAWAATSAIFSAVGLRHGARRWLGVKSLLSPQINETPATGRTASEFNVPADIQRRFRSIMFRRTMRRDPFLDEAAAQRVHEDMLSHIRRSGWQPAAPRVPDSLDWEDILRDPDGFYRGYVRAQRPVILKNVPYDRERLTTEYIRSAWGDHPMVIHDVANDGKSHGMTLNQMIEFNKAGRGCGYLSFNRTFMDANGGLLRESMCAEQIHDLLRKRRKLNGDLRVDAQLFISTESTHPKVRLARTYMHCANNLNMFFNIEGRKRWVLVDPEYSVCVYPCTFVRGTAAFLSLIKSATEAAEEAERFPLYEYCPKYQVDLEPGDVLFNPCWWWHSVETLTPASLSIAVRFGPTVFGSLFPGDMTDPNTLFTSMQVLHPDLKREVYEFVRAGIRERRERYTGRTLRQVDVRQEIEKDYSVELVLASAKTVRMWRALPAVPS
jgi:hypothetical protein